MSANRTTSRSPSPPGPALGVVLAGGLGSRLGGAKAGALLGGRPLIAHPIAALRAAGLEVIVVAKAGTPLPDLGDTRLVIEPDEPRHPLAGIVQAVREAGDRAIVAVACDIPFPPPELIARLAKPGAGPAIAADERPQPLCGRYVSAQLASLEAALARRASATAAALGATPPPELIAVPGGELFNVNTPADLERAEVLLRQGP